MKYDIGDNLIATKQVFFITKYAIFSQGNKYKIIAKRYNNGHEYRIDDDTGKSVWFVENAIEIYFIIDTCIKNFDYSMGII